MVPCICIVEHGYLVELQRLLPDVDGYAWLQLDRDASALRATVGVCDDLRVLGH